MSDRSPRAGGAKRSEALGAQDPRARRAAQARSAEGLQLGAGMALDRKGRLVPKVGRGLELDPKGGVCIRSVGAIDDVPNPSTEEGERLNELLEALRKAGILS